MYLEEGMGCDCVEVDEDTSALKRQRRVPNYLPPKVDAAWMFNTASGGASDRSTSGGKDRATLGC